MDVAVISFFHIFGRCCQLFESNECLFGLFYCRAARGRIDVTPNGSTVIGTNINKELQLRTSPLVGIPTVLVIDSAGFRMRKLVSQSFELRF